MEHQQSYHILQSQIRKSIGSKQHQQKSARQKIFKSNKIFIVISKKKSHQYYQQLTPQIQKTCQIYITELNDKSNLNNIVSILSINYSFYGFIILNSKDYLQYRQVIYSLIAKSPIHPLKNLKIMIQKQSKQNQSSIDFYTTNSEIGKFQSDGQLIEYICSPQKILGQIANHFFDIIIKHRKNIGFQINKKVYFLYQQNLGNQFKHKLESLKNETKMIKCESFKREQLIKLIQNQNIGEEFIIAITHSFITQIINLIKQKNNIKVLLISSEQQSIIQHPNILRQSNQIQILEFIKQMFWPEKHMTKLQQNFSHENLFQHDEINNQNEFLGQFNESNIKYHNDNELDKELQVRQEIHIKKLEYSGSQSQNSKQINIISQNKVFLNQLNNNYINKIQMPQNSKQKNSSIIIQQKLILNQQIHYQIPHQSSKIKSPIHHSNASNSQNKSQQDFFGLDHKSSHHSQINHNSNHLFNKSNKNSENQMVFDNKSIRSRTNKKSQIYDQQKNSIHNAQNLPQIVIHTNGTESDVQENNIINAIQSTQKEAAQNIVIGQANIYNYDQQIQIQKPNNNIVQGLQLIIQKSQLNQQNKFEKIKSGITEKSKRSNKQSEKMQSIVSENYKVDKKSTITEKQIKLKVQKFDVQSQKMKSSITEKSNKQQKQIKSIGAKKLIIEKEKKSNITEKSNKSQRLTIQPEKMKSTIHAIIPQKFNTQSQKLRSTISQKSIQYKQSIKLKSLKFHTEQPPNPPEIVTTNIHKDQISLQIIKPYYNNPNKQQKTQIWSFYNNSQQCKRIINYIQKSINRTNIKLKVIPINTFNDINQTLQYGHQNIDKVLIILKDENIKSENIVSIQQKYPKSRIYLLKKNMQVIEACLIFDLGFKWEQCSIPYKSKSMKNISSDNSILYYPPQYIYTSEFKISMKYQNLDKLENQLNLNQNPNMTNIVITNINNLKKVEKLALKYGLTKIIVISQARRISKWDFFQNYGDLNWLMINSIQQINKSLKQCIHESSKQPFQRSYNVLFYLQQQSDNVSSYKCKDFFKIRYISDKDLLQKMSRLKIGNNIFILNINEDQVLFVNVVNYVYLKNIYYHLDFGKKYFSNFKSHYYQTIGGLLQTLKNNNFISKNSCLPLIYDKNQQSSLYIIKKVYPYFKFIQIQYKPKEWIRPTGEFIGQTDQNGFKKQRILMQLFTKQRFLNYPIYKFFYLSSLIPKIQTQIAHQTAEQLLQTYQKNPNLLMIIFCDNGDEKYIPIQLHQNKRVIIIRYSNTFELKFDNLYLTGSQIQGAMNKIKMIQHSFKNNYVIYRSAKTSEMENIIKSIKLNVSNVIQKQYSNITDLNNIISQIKNRSLFMDILIEQQDFQIIQNILKQNNIKDNHKLHKFKNIENSKLGDQSKNIKQTPLIINPPQICNEVYYNYEYDKVRKLPPLPQIANQTLIIPDVSMLIMIDNDGTAKQNMKFILNNVELQKQIMYYTKNNLGNKLMEVENKIIVLILQSQKQLNSFQQVIDKINDIFIIVKSPKDNIIIQNGRFIKDWDQLQNIFKQLTLNQQYINKLFDKSEQIRIIFDQTLNKQQKILIYLISDESNKAIPIKLNSLQKQKQLQKQLPQTLFLLFSHKESIQKLFKNNPNTIRLWRKQLQNLYLHLNPNRKQMDNFLTDKNKMNVILNNKLTPNKIKLNNFVKSPEIQNPKKLLNSLSQKNNLKSNFKVQTQQNQKDKQEINDDKINDLLSQKMKQNTYNEIVRRQQNRKKKVITESTPEKVAQIPPIDQQSQKKEKLNISQDTLIKFYPILNGQIIKLFVPIQRSQLKFLVKKILGQITVIFYADIVTLSKNLSDNRKYPVIVVLDSNLHSQAKSIGDHFDTNLRIISYIDNPSVTEVINNNQQLMELLKKLSQKNKEIGNNKNKNSPSQEFNGYSMKLPIKNANQKVSLYYHQMKNASIKPTVQKYTSSRMNYIPYKNISHLKQLISIPTVDEIGIIIANDTDIEEIQRLNTFQRLIFYIRIFNQVNPYKKLITQKILYSGNSQKQVANHIISLIYRSYKQSPKIPQIGHRLKSIRSLKSIKSLNTLQKNQSQQKLPLSAQKVKQNQQKGNQNLPTTFGRAPRFQYFIEYMQIRQNRRKSQKNNALPFINKLERVKSNDKNQFKKFDEYGM